MDGSSLNITNTLSFRVFKRGSIRTLRKELVKKIRNTIKENLSPRHLPAKIIHVGDIPYTINMKKVEIAVRNIVHHKPVLNIDALANPDSLKYYENLKELES